MTAATTRTLCTVFEQQQQQQQQQQEAAQNPHTASSSPPGRSGQAAANPPPPQTAMRPIRLLLFFASFLLASLILLTIGPSWRQADTLEELDARGRLGAYFNWHAPSSSLFPPSAIISLTDDNSTFFLARPAAFGPVLPAKSLSGPLWIGSGFGDDRLSRNAGGIGAMSAEGELGCSDVPGWREGEYLSPRVGLGNGMKSSLGSDFGSGAGSSGSSSSSSSSSGSSGSKKNTASDGMAASLGKDTAAAAGAGGGVSDLDGKEDSSDAAAAAAAARQTPDKADGTDDHLHHPLPASGGLPSPGDTLRGTRGPSAAHADIQSLQESAEIAGKIVLLSRGGCGFLEKVKWVQRRGGVAVIVGDDIRGGPLVTMYARGDTSNVTIPALFTSHTTAHLLSSLMPSGGSSGGVGVEENSGRGKKGKGRNSFGGKKMTTTMGEKGERPDEMDTPKKGARKQDKQAASSTTDKPSRNDQKGWYYTFFGPRRRSAALDSRRPPSSGNIDWILQEEFEDEVPRTRGKSDKAKAAAANPPPPPPIDDGFIIGVHDWRDPDLVDLQKEEVAAEKAATAAGGKKKGDGPDSAAKGKGKSASGKTESAMLSSLQTGSTADDEDPRQSPSGSSWFGRVFRGGAKGGAVQEAAFRASSKGDAASSHAADNRPSDTDATDEDADSDDDSDDDDTTLPPPHHGLWVTLTPTSMSSSPFFDTLLVLVVSPLVTLTVVYALLLLRARLRRRRWRAPKSVVEQLPVRTYHTVASNSSSTATSSATSVCEDPSCGAGVSVTTPLLSSMGNSHGAETHTATAAAAASRPMRTRPRPRAQTTSQVPRSSSAASSSSSSSSLRENNSSHRASPDVTTTEEKRAAGLAEWRRRYGGKQRECVVCLEEYVDGVSRVMSLPCGHEFHAECM